MKKRIEREEFRAEVRAWADRIGVKPRRIQTRALTQFWASCSPSGSITFDPDLLSESKPFRDSVIVHELLHLLVPNHGKLFIALNRTYLGESAVILRRHVAICKLGD